MAIALSVLQSHYLSNSAIYWSRETPHPRGTEQFWSPNYLDMKFPFHLILKAHWNSNCKRRCLKALRHRRCQSAARKKRAMRRGRGRGRGAPRGRWPASTSAWAPAPVRPPWKRFGSWFRAASRSWRLCHLAASTGTTRETTPLATRAWRNAPNDFIISFLPSFLPSLPPSLPPPPPVFTPSSDSPPRHLLAIFLRDQSGLYISSFRPGDRWRHQHRASIFPFVFFTMNQS